MSQHIVTFPVAFVGRKANRKASSVQEQTPNYIFKATKKKKKKFSVFLALIAIHQIKEQ